MTLEEAKKLLPPELKYPLPDGTIDNLLESQRMTIAFSNSGHVGRYYVMLAVMLAALIELKEHREFVNEYCTNNDTVEACCACSLYEYGMCVNKDFAIKCRERGDDGRENKTCPFCGSDSIEVYTHYGESAGIQYGGYYPECTVCGCRLNYYDSREEALKAWNRRADNDK